MRVIPANHDLILADDFEHLEHLCLIRWVHSLYTDRGLQLWHCEHVIDLDRVLVDVLTKDYPHHLKWNARFACKSTKSDNCPN